ncbi:sensor histidine kinase [Evansella cellulosilytica]|uniref:Sensor histidine kinase n=1 Tax=Evansella cellulosilytica (strain ATCC 21833 / DSM 2522 / FERM P-1141 / JCM 9156 / N-4) TaxID=649639 RepID=E6TZP9_EVAC2|nr:sensor histidine kinase [Evansella cellulosilytica]ADU31355.1 integral membrane sensor signal transduction histidine kinase [Evansella cellulosilytica DSM 2522]
MNLMLKQIIVGVVGALIFTIIIVGTTFLIFPLEEWRLLFTTKIYDVNYLILLGGLIVMTGIIVGASYSIYFSKKLTYVHDQLEDVVKGRKVSDVALEKSKDIIPIQKQLLLLEEKLEKQAELSQRLATERTEEREKSLQEVILQERNRLARELHDSVSQQLFAASMMMSAINEGDPPEDPAVKNQLGLVERMIEQSQLEMRALLLHLRPIALKEKTLSEGMNELLTELKQKVPMEIECKIETLELEKGVEDHLFRILQESVSNALRHSKAGRLHIMLIERDEFVILRVSDDGIGFNVEEAKTNSSYGLLNMQERALEIGGTLKVVSVEQEGTRLEVKIPYRRKGGK